jgi:hypothetical protein
MPWTRRRKFAGLGVAVACVVVVGLFFPTVVGSWAPILHWTCQKGGTVVDEITWIPVVLINAPYGGYASGNGSLPAGFLGPHTYLPSAEGTDAQNGTAAGVIYQVWLNVTRDLNQTVWGSGGNVRCGQAYAISPGGTGPQPPNGYAGKMFGPGLVSDAAEPHVFNWSSGSANSTVWFSNGFAITNEKDVSTCGNSSRSLNVPLHAVNLTVEVPFNDGGRNVSESLVLPLDQSYHYWFPANFGTWQIDNLSAPGGPGGGWAFSYSPCS